MKVGKNQKRYELHEYLLKIQLLVEIREVKASDARGGSVADWAHVLRVMRSGALARDPHHAELRTTLL